MEIRDYIEASWQTLERDLTLAATAAADPKLSTRPTVFLAPTESTEPLELKNFEVVRLTRDELQSPDALRRHGLLYLPHPYVVPGGRFNEMYGWDSYFINLGLLASGRVEQAKQMVDNHLYQVKHYGKVLNANRTYYLSRSQPPFLASMVSDVLAVNHDLDWLRDAWDALQRTYDFWVREPHLTQKTGLSRYFDTGEGPAPEVLASEVDEDGLSHYQRLIQEFQSCQEWDKEKQVDRLGYELAAYYLAETETLTEACYRGDRTMRESGYDPSDRFGRFNLDVTNYNPVDLNSLLYKYEREMETLASRLGLEAQIWNQRAEDRKSRMQLLWDEQAGLFFDWNHSRGQRRRYPFATTFFPLWAGWADPHQAERVHHNLERFLQPGGLVTSTSQSGQQWDYPFGWAPLQWIAAWGLKNYDYTDSAKLVASRFNSLVESEYQRTGTIVEKYNVVESSSEVSADIDFGYSSNEIGFGWTNAVYLKLQEILAD